MSRILSVSGSLVTLLLALLLLHFAGGSGREARPRVAAGATAAVTTVAPAPSDPVARAVEDLAAWPIAAAPSR